MCPGLVFKSDSISTVHPLHNGRLKGLQPPAHQRAAHDRVAGLPQRDATVGLRCCHTKVLIACHAYCDVLVTYFTHTH